MWRELSDSSCDFLIKSDGKAVIKKCNAESSHKSCKNSNWLPKEAQPKNKHDQDEVVCPVVVEVALEAAGPLGVGAGDGEAGEELRDGARRRGPVHLPQRGHQVLRRHRAPVHRRRSNPPRGLG